MTPKTMFEKIWDDHVVVQEPDEPAVIYIDLHLVHELLQLKPLTDSEMPEGKSGVLT